MLIAENLKKVYGDRAVLDDVSLTVAEGEFLSIMGESGSGKSTLLNVLAGNLQADGGRVLLNGACVTGMNERQLAALRRGDLGFVYQSLNLVPTLNGEDNILLPLIFAKGDLRLGRARLRDLSETLGISHLMRAFPKTMSGGERQRVAIARAMLHDPKVLMLDEPTGSLDSRSTEQVMELLQLLNRENRLTMVQVTHSASAASYGSRTVVLSDGKLSEA